MRWLVCLVVGAQGKRVLVVDDVITAGTAIREAFGILREMGATPTGVVIALDRQVKRNTKKRTKEEEQKKKEQKNGRTKQVKRTQERKNKKEHRTKQRKEQEVTKTDGTKAQRKDNSSEQLQLRKRTEYQDNEKKEMVCSTGQLCTAWWSHDNTTSVKNS